MITNPAHIAETALLIAAAYLLGCMLGYAGHRIVQAGRGNRRIIPALAPSEVHPPPIRRRSNAARLAASAGEPERIIPRSAPKAAASPRPAGLDAPRNGTADNLKIIKGIGPKIEASLYALGIYHVDQIAGWNAANVAWVDSQLAFKGRIVRERWVEQAKALATAVV